jgi:glutamate/tyrosine decarboxylase-like PLP-dependent enzyme
MLAYAASPGHDDRRAENPAPQGRPDNAVCLPCEASPLFPAQPDRNRIDEWLTCMLADADARVRAGPVHATLDREVLAGEIAGWQFETPGKLEDVLAWTIERMERGLIHINHPRYFGLFNPAPTFPAQCADRITASFNPQLATVTTSPFAVELEAHVVRTIAHRAGLPSGSAGHFTTGGSEANATALICALTNAHASFAANGARCFNGQPTFYVSRDSHLAWLKIAHQAGIGRDAVRLVDTDGAGRMDPQALLACMARDLANGDVPVMIVATAGTTNAGMIDPLAACAEIARRYNLWYHVDAAWGGAVVVSDTWRTVLAGIETADSVTIDAHKWLATTMGCGIFMTSRPTVLSASFQAVMTCMPSNLPSIDPYVTTMQWSRRFAGLRLFLALATAGWRGYAQHVEQAIDLAAELSATLVASGWRRVNDSPLAVVCVLPPEDGQDFAAIVSTLVKSGVAWISTAEFAGRPVIRACITNGLTTRNDVAALADSMIALARH